MHVCGMFGPWWSGGWVKPTPGDRVDGSEWNHMEYRTPLHACCITRGCRRRREKRWRGSDDDLRAMLRR